MKLPCDNIDDFINGKNITTQLQQTSTRLAILSRCTTTKKNASLE